MLCYKIRNGEMAEWSIAAVLKTVEPKGSRGSNPLLSAIYIYTRFKMKPGFQIAAGAYYYHTISYIQTKHPTHAPV